MIHMNFFQGENSYIQDDGKLARNRLKKEYDRFLYVNNLPRSYDVAALEKAAKQYRGPIAQKKARLGNLQHAKFVALCQSDKFDYDQDEMSAIDREIEELEAALA